MAMDRTGRSSVALAGVGLSPSSVWTGTDETGCLTLLGMTLETVLMLTISATLIARRLQKHRSRKRVLARLHKLIESGL